jgi:outer membrane protein OmpA-like peptidoglycan-associated protein
MELLTSSVGSKLLGPASKFLGESESATNSALGGILPSVLGGLMDKSSDSAGAGAIMDLLSKSDDGILDNVSDIFSGGSNSGGISNLLSGGSGALGLLFGNNKLGSLVDLITSSSGMKKSSSSTLLKLAAPFIMSVVGKKVKSMGLDALGLTKLLGSQKEHIASALPSGFGDALGIAGLGGGLMDKATDAVGDIVGGGADAVKNVGGAAMGAAGAVSGAAKGAAGAAGDAVKNVGGAAMGAAMGAAGAAGDMAKGAAGAAGGAVKNVGGAAMDAAGAAGDMAKGAAGAAGGAVKNVGGAAMGAAGAAGDVAKKGGNMLMKWLLPALIALLAIGYFVTRQGCSTGVDALDNAADTVTNTTESIATGAADAVGDVAGAAGDMAKGVFGAVNDAAKAALDKIEFAAGSVGSQMMDYIKDGADGEKVFTFNNLTFASGSSTIQEASYGEVDNLAAILKTYEDVNIAIEGYTDNTGNAAMNEKLSLARAEAVKVRLESAGIDASRISAAGFGSANPKETNDTPEGRAMNRRIEVRIVK